MMQESNIEKQYCINKEQVDFGIHTRYSTNKYLAHLFVEH